MRDICTDEILAVLTDPPPDRGPRDELKTGIVRMTGATVPVKVTFTIIEVSTIFAYFFHNFLYQRGNIKRTFKNFVSII